MHEAVSALLVVQDRDSRIEAILQGLNKVPAERRKIIQYKEQKQENHRKAKKSLLDTEQAIKNSEAEIESRQANLRKLKTQQMETRKNEEYQAFTREIARVEQEIDDLETRELELMDQLDVRKAEYDIAEKKHQEVEQGIDNELATLDQKESNLQKEKEGLQGEREKLIAPIDLDTLELYDRMKMSKGLPVIVLLTDAGECSGCHTKVIRTTETKVRTGAEIVECENCGRILY